MLWERYLLIAAVLFVAGCDKEPKTYEDCVLQKIERVEGRAAMLLEKTCREKFSKLGDPVADTPPPEKKTQTMTIEEAFAPTDGRETTVTEEDGK